MRKKCATIGVSFFISMATTAAIPALPTSAIVAGTVPNAGGYILFRGHEKKNGSAALAEVSNWIAMDSKNVGLLKFKSLSGSSAALSQLGISIPELISYNNSLEEINSIARMISKKTANLVNTNGDVAQIAEFAHSQWQSASWSIPPLAFSVLTKVSAQIQRAEIKDALE